MQPVGRLRQNCWWLRRNVCFFRGDVRFHEGTPIIMPVDSRVEIAIGGVAYLQAKIRHTKLDEAVPPDDYPAESLCLLLGQPRARCQPQSH